MLTFWLSFLVILLVVLVMSVGVLCRRPPLVRGCAHLMDLGGSCAGCSKRRRRDGDCT